MLTRRIIPCLDVKDGRVVKGKSFIQLKDAGDPAELAEYYCQSGADELVFLDITATTEGRDTMVEVVERVSEKVSIPLTVGGGLRTLADVRRMLQAGANKVSFNTAAIRHPGSIPYESSSGESCGLRPPEGRLRPVRYRTRVRKPGLRRSAGSPLWACS